MLPTINDLELPEQYKDKVIKALEQRAEHHKRLWQVALPKSREINYYLGKFKEDESFIGRNHKED